MATSTKTTVGKIEQSILKFTAGKDYILDRALVEYDCLGTAAHVWMLSELDIEKKLFLKTQAQSVIQTLITIMRRARLGTFKIRLSDQDVHLAVERELTRCHGDLGRKVHTARSRNDQVALDLRLYARDQLLSIMEGMLNLAAELARLGKRHELTPMAGRTHMQPAMPSSVGVWASCYTEDLLDTMTLCKAAWDHNNKSPLGSAAGFGVPLQINRQRVADLLGFDGIVHNVLYASNARGKNESVIMDAVSQVMVSLSRLAQDLIIYGMPEFNYFSLPDELCTGSSIMPQKKNPDALELMRAKTARVIANAQSAKEILRASISGYNRDIQEIKELFMESLETVGASLSVMSVIVKALTVNKKSLLAGFTPELFATDEALQYVADGMPFRKAYDAVKCHLQDLEHRDPKESIMLKKHAGAPLGLDFSGYRARINADRRLVDRRKKHLARKYTALLGVSYPTLEDVDLIPHS